MSNTESSPAIKTAETLRIAQAAALGVDGPARLYVNKHHVGGETFANRKLQQRSARICIYGPPSPTHTSGQSLANLDI